MNNKKKFYILIFLFAVLIVSCAHREGEPDVRTNPYDPKNVQWTQNTAPVISVSIDSLWHDFNHSTASGTIGIHVAEDDLNFPYDTLVGSVFYNGKEIKLPRFSSKKDTTILLSGIKLNTAVQCTVKIYDSRQSPGSKILSITPPDSFPDMPPSTSVINGSQEVILTWRNNPTTNYLVYYSDSLKGPYSDSIIVNKTNNNTVTVYNQPSGYLPRYYIVGTANKFGTAFSTDTLIGRIFYSSIATPAISNISQGSYSTHIVLTCNVSTYNTSYIEIYRSINDTSSFRFIGTSKITSNYNSYSYSTGNVYYYDSVNTPSTCFYKIHLIDNMGRCSFPSAVRYGYLQRLYAPTLYIKSYADIIDLSWTSVSGATKYRVYRSALNCIDSLNLFTETDITSCTDSPPDNKIYYYSVRAVSSNSLEGTRGSCIQGKITLLPQPDSIVVTTNYYPRHVALAWRKVTGANGYIVYRSKNYNDITPIDTISSNIYNDTLPDNSLCYYRIAAFNSRGTGLLSSAYNGSVITPVIMNYSSRNDSIFLTFTPNNRTIKYFVYGSSNQSDFTLLDSTTKSSYNAPRKDYDTRYYRFTIQTPEGVSFPSSSISINQQLSTPYNIKITQLLYGVRIEWNKVLGAERYALYKSSNAGVNISSTTIYRLTADTFFVDTLPEGSSFYYSLRSLNSMMYSSYSSEFKGSRLAPPEPPIVGFVSSQLRAIYLSWSMPTGSSTPEGFAIFRSTNNSNYKLIDSTKNFFYYDSVPDTIIYYYQIRAYNALGYSALPNGGYSGYLLRPSAPQNLTGTLATSTAYIRITWSPVSSINKYSIYRSISQSGPYEYLVTVQNTTMYDDYSCNVNDYYYYKVTSVTADNQSFPSFYVLGIRLGTPAISTINRNDYGNMIWWNNLPYPIQHYNIYRAEAVGGPYTRIDSATNLNYLDFNGKATSFYKISATNTVESALSNAATVNTSPPSISVSASQGTKTNAIEISWTPVSGNPVYQIYRAPTDTFNRNIIGTGAVTSTTHTEVVMSDSIYYFKIAVITSNDEASAYSIQTAAGYRYPTTIPQRITSANCSSESDNISLSWNKPSTSVGYNKYNIYRSTSSNGSFELIGSTTETLYRDIPPQKFPMVYWYTIKAVNQVGESAPSGYLSGYLTQ